MGYSSKYDNLSMTKQGNGWKKLGFVPRIRTAIIAKPIKRMEDRLLPSMPLRMRLIRSNN
jgi:hypothetical protein